jgi:hypothetical protein
MKKLILTLFLGLPLMVHAAVYDIKRLGGDATGNTPVMELIHR